MIRKVSRLLLVALLAGCGGGGPAPPRETDGGLTNAVSIVAAEGRKANPLASPNALKGGMLTVFSGGSPKSLNFYLDNNTFSAGVFGSLYETLLGLDPLTFDFTPNIAEKWEVSADGLTFTFTIDANARWSDGSSITADDVRFTYDTIMDPKNMTGVFKVGLDRFDRPEVIDEHTIRFVAHENHWKNLLELSGISILPRHALDGKDFNTINFEFPVVSGPYRVKEWKEGRYLDLGRRDDWWQKDYPDVQGLYNFDVVRHRMLEDREDAYKLFARGEIDVYPVYTSRIWVDETKGEKFEKNWIVKQRVYNYEPRGFQGWVMNMRHTPFDDIKVRRAMAHLVDRRTMNSTLMFNQYFLQRSYYGDLYDAEHPCPNALVEFDVEAARALLNEAGYIVNAKGRLEKNGSPLVVNFLVHGKESVKFVDVFREALGQLGIEIKIDLVDTAEFFKRMDEGKFSMTWASWASAVFKDPEDMWHSKFADEKGNNRAGFKNARVDELIEKQKTVLDLGERNAIIREIDAIVYNAMPYVLLWNADNTRLLYWNRFGTPPTVLDKFSDERSAYTYWWFDPEKDAELGDAMKTGKPLPPAPADVRFDEAFRR